MRRIVLIALAGGALAALGGCATMSEEQCLAGDWGGKGYQDGFNGYRQSRLDNHAQACAKVGVSVNAQAYYSAREAGLRSYCRWENGFEEGRKGRIYGGVCTPEEESRFVPAYEDGRALHSAELAISNAESRVRSAASRIDDRERKLWAKERELNQAGLSREERELIRMRIREVREELRDARHNLRDAELELREVEYDARGVIRAISSQYGVW